MDISLGSVKWIVQSSESEIYYKNPISVECFFFFIGESGYAFSI